MLFGNDKFLTDKICTLQPGLQIPQQMVWLELAGGVPFRSVEPHHDRDTTGVFHMNPGSSYHFWRKRYAFNFN